MKDVQKIIADLKKDGAKVVNAIVKNVTATEEVAVNGKTYLRLCLTLDKEIPAYVQKGDDYIEGESRFAYILSGSVGHFLSEDEETAFIKDSVCASKVRIKAILTYAKVQLLCEKVKGKTQYCNPFSENEEKTELDNDNIFHHLIGLELGSMGRKHAQKYTEHDLFAEDKED